MKAPARDDAPRLFIGSHGRADGMLASSEPDDVPVQWRCDGGFFPRLRGWLTSLGEHIHLRVAPLHCREAGMAREESRPLETCAVVDVVK